VTPGLKVHVDERAACTLERPAAAKNRAWLLGVVAVQLRVENGHVTARLRAHRTGDATPTVVELAHAALVRVALTDGETAASDAPVAWDPAPRAGERARVTLFLEGEPIGEAVLKEAAMRSDPPPRAFGHVFCRWLRDGSSEPGFDLTDFISPPPGLKFARKILRPLAVGQTVAYGLSLT
jgi:hypothetical protein